MTTEAATDRDAYLTHLRDEARAFASATACFDEARAKLAKAATAARDDVDRFSVSGALGFARSRLAEATEAHERLAKSRARLDAVHAVGRDAFGLGADEFAATTGLDAETYGPRS